MGSHHTDFTQNHTQQMNPPSIHMYTEQEQHQLDVHGQSHMSQQHQQQQLKSNHVQRNNNNFQQQILNRSQYVPLNNPQHGGGHPNPQRGSFKRHLNVGQAINRQPRVNLNSSQARNPGANSSFQLTRSQTGHASTGIAQNQSMSIGNKRQGVSETEFPLRMIVQSDMVGAIIGRSGTTIKQITQSTKARVDVHREDCLDHKEKVITITGDPESCSNACFRIVEIILNEKLSYSLGKSSSNSLENQTSNEEQDFVNQFDVQLKLLAHNNLIARLIGKNGASIKKIMEQTSTKINISARSLSESTYEHTISVVGTIEQLRQAEKIISSKLRAAYLADVSSSLLSMNHQPYLFNNVPMPYMSPYSQNSILSSLVNVQPGHTNSAMTRGVPIPPHQNQISSSLYTGSQNYLPIYPHMTVPTPGSGLVGYSPFLPNAESEKETVNIYIPNNMVGAIIGKSGLAIKEMINTSGASIKVAAATLLSDSSKNDTITDRTEHSDEIDSSKNSTEPDKEESLANTASNHKNPSNRQINHNDQNQSSIRKVTIVGSSESQCTAQYMIYRKICIESAKSDISLMVEIQVPSQYVGKIIGKGGNNVKQIQLQTRTIIRLLEDKSSSSTDDSSSSETYVQITGEYSGSQLAQRHIRHLIKESPFPNSRNQINKQYQGRGNDGTDARSTAQSSHDDNQNRCDNVNNTSASDDVYDDTASKSYDKSTDYSTHRSDEEVSPENESPSLEANVDSQQVTTDQQHSSEQGSQKSMDEYSVSGHNEIVTADNNNTANKNVKALESTSDDYSNNDTSDNFNEKA